MLWTAVVGSKDQTTVTLHSEHQGMEKEKKMKTIFEFTIALVIVFIPDANKAISIEFVVWYLIRFKI